jgi:hypothetical protein
MDAELFISMSASGTKQTSRRKVATSVFERKADIGEGLANFRE